MNRQDAAEELKTEGNKTFAPLEVEEGRGGQTGAKAWESRAAPVIAFVKRCVMVVCWLRAPSYHI